MTESELKRTQNRTIFPCFVLARAVAGEHSFCRPPLLENMPFLAERYSLSLFTLPMEKHGVHAKHENWHSAKLNFF